MKHKHRLLSVLLSAVLVLGLLPAAAFAEGEIAEDVPSAAPQSAAPAEAAPATQAAADGVSAQANTAITTWAELQTAFTAGGEITLTQDITATDSDTALTVPKDVTVTLDLNGHTIDRGLAGKAAVNGGNVISVNGTLTINDSSTGQTGKITGGNNNNNGGGIHVENDGTFTLNGGTITGNKAATDIYNNYRNGGGVCVFGAFTMTGGTITNNEAAKAGGGIYVEGSFTMTGGSICDNRADVNGGGITVYGNNVKLLGGEITGNSGGYGSGVYVNSSTLTVGSSIVIQNNKYSSSRVCNVQFHDSTGKFVLSADKPLTSDAKIGWTASSSSDVTSTGLVIATGTNVAKYAKAFTSDSGSFIFGLKVGEPDTLYCATSGSSTVKVPHTVTITAGANMSKTSGEAVQEYVVGEMTPVVYTATNDKTFPAYYVDRVTGLANGVTVTRDSETQITVSGTPTADVTISLPSLPVPVFNDGLGKDDCNFNTYAVGDKHPTKGYTFDGWYNDADNTPLTNINDAAAGAAYTARWLNSYHKIVRTTPLDLTQPLVLGDTGEGWKWDDTTKTLTLNGATFDVNVKEASGVDSMAAIILPNGAKIATQSGSKNVILNHSTLESVEVGNVVCGVVSHGALTINGSGELTIDAIDCGLFAMDSLTINAPITVNTDTADGIAVLVVGAAPRITIPSSLYISTPTNGKVSVSSLDEGDKAASIVSGNDPAKDVVIRAVKYYYKTPGTTNTTTPAKSPKTADAGIALYAGMAMASLLGSGVVFTRKRRNF